VSVLAKNLVEALLRLSGLAQHSVEEPPRADLSVPMGDRDPTRNAPGGVELHPDFVVATPLQREAVPTEDSSKLVQTWRHEQARPTLLGEAESLEPAEDRRVEESDVALLPSQLRCHVRRFVADIAQPGLRRADEVAECSSEVLAFS
jgi:hypothetical protein